MRKMLTQLTKDDEYYTPKKVVEMFGSFDYDPATTKEKAKELKIQNYDTIKTDGLAQDWTKYKKIWINPPFTRKNEFIKKAQETYSLVKNEIYILFPIGFMTTTVFHETVTGGVIYIPNGRISFESGLGKKGKSPAFGSVIMKFSDNWGIEMIDIK